MVEHEICLLTLTLSHTGHVDDSAENRSGSRTGYLYRAGASQ